MQRREFSNQNRYMVESSRYPRKNIKKDQTEFVKIIPPHANL